MLSIFYFKITIIPQVPIYINNGIINNLSCFSITFNLNSAPLTNIIYVRIFVINFEIIQCVCILFYFPCENSFIFIIFYRQEILVYFIEIHIGTITKCHFVFLQRIPIYSKHKPIIDVIKRLENQYSYQNNTCYSSE